MNDDAQSLGERISFHRRRLGLSQVEFASAVDRSESWVSQVERGARRIDRLSVLQKIADALGVSVAELRGQGEEDEEAPAERPESFEDFRLVLTGHPAMSTVMDGGQPPHSGHKLEQLREQHARVPTTLSTERQARFLIDVARAQVMRRHIGEAFDSLRRAEDLAPEQTRSLKPARETAADLIQLAGNRARTELRDLASRFGAL